MAPAAPLAGLWFRQHRNYRRITPVRRQGVARSCAFSSVLRRVSDRTAVVFTGGRRQSCRSQPGCARADHSDVLEDGRCYGRDWAHPRRWAIAVGCQSGRAHPVRPGLGPGQRRGVEPGQRRVDAAAARAGPPDPTTLVPVFRALTVACDRDVSAEEPARRWKGVGNAAVTSRNVQSVPPVTPATLAERAGWRQ